jgi:hypothetical protein
LQCIELPNVADTDVARAFLMGTTCKELIHELGARAHAPLGSSWTLPPTLLPMRRR